MSLLFYLHLLSCYLVSSMWIRSDATPIQALWALGASVDLLGESWRRLLSEGFVLLFWSRGGRLKVLMLKFKSAGSFFLEIYNLNLQKPGYCFVCIIFKTGDSRTLKDKLKK